MGAGLTENRLESIQSRVAEFGREHTFGLIAALLSISICLLHLWFIRKHPTFDAPIIDSLDYVRDALAVVDGSPESEPYYHSPLYIWMLAAIFKIAGYHLLVVRLAQIVLSAFSCFLLYLIADRLFSRPVARASALIWALYGPLVFYTDEVLNVSCILALYLSALYLVIRAADRRSPRDWLTAGAVVGFAALARPDILPFAAIVCLAILRSNKGSPARLSARAAPALAFALAVAAPLLIVGVRNYQVSGRFMVLPASGGFNLYQGNNSNYRETIGIRLESWQTLLDMPLADGSASEINASDHGRYYYRKVLQFASRDPAGFAECALYKVRSLLNGYELPESFDMYTYRRYSPLLASLVWRLGAFSFPYGVLLPFAVLGGLVSWKHRREAWPLWALLAGLLPSLLGYWNSSRYRLSIVPILIILASAALVWFWTAHRQKRKRSLALALGFMALLAAVCSAPFPHFSKTFDFDAEAYALAGTALVTDGRVEEGFADMGHALDLEPNSYYAHFKMAQGLVQVGRVDEALAEFQRTVEINPAFYDAYTEMGIALAGNKRFDEALPCFAKAIEGNPRLFTAYYFAGKALASKGQFDEALQYISKSLEINSGASKTHFLMGEVLAAKGQFDGALASYARAAALDPQMFVAYNQMGLMWERKGDLDNATRCFAKAVEINPNYDLGKKNLSRLQRR